MSKTYIVREGTTGATSVTTSSAEELVEVHVTYYVDNTFAAEATPGAGTVAVVGTRKDGRTTTIGTLDATDPNEFVSAVGNFKSIAITPAGITVAGAYEVTVVATDSY